MTLALLFQVHGVSEVSVGIWQQHTAYSFHTGGLRGVRGRGISTGEYRRGNSPFGRPHWSGSLLTLKGTSSKTGNGP